MSEMNESVKRMDSVYSEDVVFEGSMIWCNLELGIDGAAGRDCRGPKNESLCLSMEF